MTEKKLTMKQDLFVRSYLENNGNATQAAITAGYSKKTAYSIGGENLSKPEIVHEINKLQNKVMKKVEDKVKVTYEWKVQKLKDLIEKCATGEGFKDGWINASGLVSALSELNKMHGDYAPEKRINTNVNIEMKAQVDKLIKVYEKEI
jgi:hypothetical protein